MKRLLDTDTRFFDEYVVTTQLVNEWGCMVNLLDEVLVEGTATQPVLMFKTVQDTEDPDCWLVTVTTQRTVKYTPGATVVEIANASIPEYNGIFRVQEVPSDTSFTVAISKSKVSDKPNDLIDASGTTVRLPSLGYTKVFSGNQKAVYKSNHPKATKAFLRVDNSCPVGYNTAWAKYARVSMYTDMSHIDDYHPTLSRLKAPYNPRQPLIGEEPKGSGESMVAGWARWYYKRDPADYQNWDHYTNNTPGSAQFEIIGDSRTFYFMVGLERHRTGGVLTNIKPRVGYAFGEYEEIDDPSNQSNHILISTLRTNRVNEVYGYYSHDPGDMEQWNSFSRARTVNGKVMFNSESFKDSELPSATFSFEAPFADGVRSGGHTGYSFNRYTFTLNLSKPYVRMVLPEKHVLKGLVRGYHFILNNLGEYTVKIPSFKSIISNIKGKPDKRFIMLRCFQVWGSGNNDVFDYPNIAFELNNWG